MAHHEPLELERFLPYRLSILSLGVSQEIAREYRERFHLSMTEWRVLAVLARWPGSSAREVAARTAMDKVAVSRALAKLAAAGRIDRRRDAGDRRRAILQLNAAGWRVHDAVAPFAREQEARMLARLDTAEIEALNRVIDKLAPLPDAPAGEPDREMPRKVVRG